MSAPTAGRNFPINVTFIVQNQQQAIGAVQALQSAFTGLQSGATGSASSVDAWARSTARVGQTANTASTSIRNLGTSFSGVRTSAGQAGSVFSSTTGATNNLANATNNTTGAVNRSGASWVGMRASVGAAGTVFADTARAANTTTGAVNNLGTGMSRGAALSQAFMHSGRGLVFGFTGLTGALSEALFMTESYGNAVEKVTEAQAEVDRLIAEGKQGTAEYTQATQALDKAQRALNFTQRLTIQSWFDIITFLGMIGTLLPRVFSEYSRLRGGVEAVSGALSTKAKILNALRGAFGLHTAALTTNTAATFANEAAQSKQVVSMGRLNTVSKSIVPGLAAASAAQGGLAAATTATTAATLPFTGAMNKANTTTRSIVPSLVAAGGAQGTFATLTGASTGALAGLTAALTKVGHAMKVFFLSPAGLIITAAAAIVVGIIALRENWFGMADAAYGASESLRKVADELRNSGEAHTEALIPAEEAAGLYEAEANASDMLLGALGVLTPAQREQKTAQEELNAELEKLTPATEEAARAVSGLGMTWEQTVESTNKFLLSLADTGDVMANRMTAAIDAVATALKENPTNPLLLQQQQLLQDTSNEWDAAAGRIQAALNLVGVSAQTELDYILMSVHGVEEAFSSLPTEVQNDMQEVVTALDLGVEGVNGLKLEASDLGAIIQGVMSGVIVPEMQKLPPEIQKNIKAMIAWAQNTKDPEASLQQLGITLTQMLIPALQYETGATEEAAAALTPYAQSVAEAAKEVGILTQVTNENAQSIAAEVTAKQRQIQVTTAVAEAMNGLNAQSLAARDANYEIVKSILMVGQGFDETAVSIAAQASGLQQWQGRLAEAHFSIVETATALGYMGDTSVAAAGQMLQFTAAAEKQNEINTQGVETYFQLSEAAQANLEVMGLSVNTMGQVAEGRRNLNEEESLAIQVMAGVDEAQARNVEGMIELVRSGKSVQDVIKMTNQKIEDEIRALEASGEAHKATAEEALNHAQAISELHPAVQALAEAWGVASIEGKNVTAVFQGVVDMLGEVDSQVKSTIAGTLELAQAQGVDMAQAAQMSEQELAMLLTTMTEVAPTAEQAAEASKQAAQDMAESWEQELQRVVEAWNTTSEQLAEAADNISDEIGDAGAEGAAKFTEGFLSEFVPQQVIEEAFDENIDMEDLIDDIRTEAEDALADGLITPAVMRESIEPMLAELEKIPGESERQAGEMIAVWRHAMTNLAPVISGGIHVVGVEAQKSIKSGVLDPIQNMLEGGAGKGVWGPLITNFREVVNALPPEYDRMKGDWLKTLELAGSDTRSQVNVILGILQEIAPEWAEQIMQMDQDSDGIKDIFDNKISTPAEQMRDALVDAWIAIFDAWSKADPTFKAAADSLRAFKAAAEETSGSTDQFGIELDALREKFGFTQSEVENLMLNFDGYVKSSGAGANMSAEFAAHLDTLTGSARQNAIDMFEAATGIDLFADGVETTAGRLVQLDTDMNGVVDTTATLADGFAAIDLNMDGLADVTREVSEGFVALDVNGDGVADTIREVADGMVALDRNLDGVVDSIEPLPAGMEAVDTNGDGMADSLQKVGTEAGTAAPPLGQFQGWLAPIATDASTAAGNLGGFHGWLAPIATDVETAGNNMATAEGQVAQLNTVLATSIDVLTKVSTLWFGNAQAIGAFVNTIGQHLGRLAQGYDLLVQVVQEAVRLMESAWSGHAGAISGHVNTTGQHLGRLAEGYNQLVIVAQGAKDPIARAMGDIVVEVGSAVDQMNAHFRRIDFGALGVPKQGKPRFGQKEEDVQGVSFQPAKGIGPPGSEKEGKPEAGIFSAFMSELRTLHSVVEGITTELSVMWLGHSQAVQLQIDLAGQAMGRYALGYSLLLGVVQEWSTQMATSWLGHGQMVGGQVDISGQALGRYATGYSLLLGVVQEWSTQMATSWLGHAAMVGGQVNTAGQHLGRYAQGYNQLLLVVQTGITQMATAWLGHAAMVGGQVDALIAHMQRGATAFLSFVAGIIANLPVMSQAWTQHATDVGTAITTVITHMQTLATAFLSFVSGIIANLPVMSQAWTQHATDVGTAVTTIIGHMQTAATAFLSFVNGIIQNLGVASQAWTQHASAVQAAAAQIVALLGQLINDYGTFAQQVHQQLESINQNWAAHAQHINSMVTNIIQSLDAAIQQHNTYADQVHQMLENANQNWQAHADHINTMVTNIISSLDAAIQQHNTYADQVHAMLQNANENWSAHAGHVASMITNIGSSLATGGQHHNTYATTVHAQLQNANENWSAHAGHVSSMVSNVGQSTTAGGQAHHEYAQTVHAQLENANQNWEAHANYVRQVTGDIAGYVSSMASSVVSSMNSIISAMNSAAEAATQLKSRIDALESKTITVTTRYETVGSPPSGGGGVTPTAAGFHGVVSQPTRFLVGEGGFPEFVSVTPLAGKGRNSQRVGTGGAVSGGRTSGTLHIPVRGKNTRVSADYPIGNTRLVGMGEDFLKKFSSTLNSRTKRLADGTANTVSVGGGSVTVGEEDLGEKAISLILNERFEGLETKPEDQFGEKVIDYLKQATKPTTRPDVGGGLEPAEKIPPATGTPGTGGGPGPGPGRTPRAGPGPGPTQPMGPTPEEIEEARKAAEAERKRLEEEFIKYLEDRKAQIEEIMTQMESVQRQIGKQADFMSDKALEKWVNKILPPLSKIPISMHYSSIKAMPIRSRYQQHKEGLINMRKTVVEWIEGERTRQKEEARKIEEQRQKLIDEYESFIEQHGTIPQQRALARKRELENLAYKRELMGFTSKYGGQLDYVDMVENYYDKMAKSVPPPGKAPARQLGTDRGIKAQFGFHGIVRKPTNLLVGEKGAERVDVSPMRERYKAGEIRKDVEHFVSNVLTQLGGAGGGALHEKREGDVVEVTIPITTELNGKVLSRQVRRYLIDGVSSMR